MIERIRIRRDSAANWVTYNPILATGEAGYETTTNRLKIGNGTSTWSSLPYLAGGSATVLKFGNGGVDDAYIWYSSDRLNLIGSGGTSIYFDQSANKIVFSSLTGVSTTQSSVTGALGYTPQPSGNYSISGHQHNISDIVNLQNILDSKQTTGTYANLTHQHQIADISGLANALNSKQPSGNYSVSGHNHPLYISDGINRVLTYSTSEELKIRGSGNTQVLFNDSTNTITIASAGGSAGSLDPNTVVLTTGNQNISGTKTFANTGIFESGLISLRNTVLQIQNTSTPTTHFIIFTGDPSVSPKQIYTRTPTQIKTDLDLSNLTNHTQIKKTDQTTIVGNIPFWNSISGDLLGSGYGVSSNLISNSGTGYLVRADAAVSYFAWSGRNIFAGSGLSGGGALNNDITINIGKGDGISVNNDVISVDNTVVRTTGDQIIDGIKTFSTGIFSTISGIEGIFESLFTSSIGLTGTNNKLFLTAGTGISFIFHDSDNILEIAADASVLNVGDTLVLRDIAGNIYGENFYSTSIHTSIVHSSGELLIVSQNNMMLDNKNDGYNSFADGSNNFIIGTSNNKLHSLNVLAYSPSTGVFCVGNDNIFNGSNSCTILGNNSTSISANNSIAIGNNALVYGSGQMSYSNGKFSYDGDSQKITYLARGITINDDICILTLDGTAPTQHNIFVVPTETTWAFYGQISAYDYIGGYGAAFNIRGGIRRNGSNETKLIGSFIKESWIEPEIEGIYVSITADDTEDSLKIEVLGKNGASIKWTCELNVIQNSNNGPTYGIPLS
jgi:VCBS repeat-containing protein